ncbi:MAG: sensor histidine kinase [Bryobacteraceae bacterium]
MRSLRTRSAAWVALVLVSAIILAFLAALQYRWISELSAAYLERGQASLETAVGQFLQDFHTELQQVCLEFRPEPAQAGRGDWLYLAYRYGEWQRTARRHKLVAGLFIWGPVSGGSPRLLSLSHSEMRLKSAPWPVALEPLRPRFDRMKNSRLLAWTISERIPALIRPLVRYSAPPGAREGAPPEVVGYLILELSREYIRSELLRELVARHFGGRGGLAYRVDIADPASADGFLYRSDATRPALTPATAAAAVRLIGPPLSEAASQLDIGPQPPRGASLVLPEDDATGWLLLVEPRQGSLAGIAAALRRRDLALSLGVLLLLAVSMGLIILFTYRYQRLARLQLDFVAGVSHELRTPLAVICSAADNLADGVVGSSAAVMDYGQLIRNEGRRLEAMVEQILRFSAAPGSRYEVRPVWVGEIIDAVVEEFRSSIGAAGFLVETKVDPELPQARTDPAVLRQCLQNLISNALKYGTDGKWMSIRAMVATEAQGPEIQVTVEDRGRGIPPGEQEQIFEPFYRGEYARTAQTHGTGLGLSLTKRIVEAVGGRVSVISTPGRGSAFTLHLPIAWP